MNDPSAQLSGDDRLSAPSDAQRHNLADSLVADPPLDDGEALRTPVTAEVPTHHVLHPKFAGDSRIGWTREANTARALEPRGVSV